MPVGAMSCATIFPLQDKPEGERAIVFVVYLPAPILYSFMPEQCDSQMSTITQQSTSRISSKLWICNLCLHAWRCLCFFAEILWPKKMTRSDSQEIVLQLFWKWDRNGIHCGHWWSQLHVAACFVAAAQEGAAKLPCYFLCVFIGGSPHHTTKKLLKGFTRHVCFPWVYQQKSMVSRMFHVNAIQGFLIGDAAASFLCLKQLTKFAGQCLTLWQNLHWKYKGIFDAGIKNYWLRWQSPWCNPSVKSIWRLRQDFLTQASTNFRSGTNGKPLLWQLACCQDIHQKYTSESSWCISHRL